MYVVCPSKDEKERMRPERMGDDLQSTDQVPFTLQIREAEGATPPQQQLHLHTHKHHLPQLSPWRCSSVAHAKLSLDTLRR